MLSLTLSIILILSIYLYIKYCHTYWEKRNIPTLKPSFLVGNMYECLLGKENFIESVVKSYKTFKNYKYVGYYKCLSPALIINDPELIGKVLVQDFNHFADNVFDVTEEADLLMAKNLFTMKGHLWKTTKNLMTPMFTSGKLKLVYPLISDSCRKLTDFINKRITDRKNHEVDGKYLSQQYTTENVANCVFGIEAKAFETDKSEFVEVARIFGSPSFLQMLKININFVIPSISKIMSLSFFTKYVENYLLDVVAQTLRYRKETNLVRNDYLDMIAQLKDKSKEIEFNDKDVTAQAATFFGDGIETSAIVMSYILFEVATHSEVQDQLRDEIKTVIERHNGKITYEALTEMNYLDAVISETLRLNVPAMVIFKSCSKSYELPPPIDGVPGIVVNPGDNILIPVEGLHKDEEYFPEVDKFQPERFLKENKQNLHKYTYLPFGEGPRLCLGMRFGVLQVKAALAHIILNFHVNINKKMQIPLILEPNSFLRSPIGGFWFDFDTIRPKP